MKKKTAKDKRMIYIQFPLYVDNKASITEFCKALDILGLRLNFSLLEKPNPAIKIKKGKLHINVKKLARKP